MEHSGQVGNAYLHLPGVIVAENTANGERRYLLSDGLGSIRQAVDETGAVVAYNEYDPYGNPTFHSSLFTLHYGYTGEWWESEVGLLHLRARWYSPGTGTFLSVDSVEGEPPYAYVRGNPVNSVDPSGLQPPDPLNDCDYCNFKAGGYSEGYSRYFSRLFVLPFAEGDETVYDFATMERASFSFITQSASEDIKFTGVGTGVYEGGVSVAYVGLQNFRSTENIENDYRGPFDNLLYGLNTAVLQLGFGRVEVKAPGNGNVTGKGWYYLLGIGIDGPLPPVSFVRMSTFYTYEGDHEWYTTTGTEFGLVTESEITRMANDIYYGRHLPGWNVFTTITEVLGQQTQRPYAGYELMQTWRKHKDYFTRYFAHCHGYPAVILK